MIVGTWKLLLLIGSILLTPVLFIPTLLFVKLHRFSTFMHGFNVSCQLTVCDMILMFFGSLPSFFGLSQVGGENGYSSLDR